MQLHRPVVVGIIVLSILVLSGCGTLIVQVENPHPNSPLATGTLPGSGIETTTSVPQPDRTPASSPTLLELPTRLPVQEATSTEPGIRLIPGTTLKISRIKMLDPQNGWSIAQVENDLYAHILFTSDGGKTWKDKTPIQALAGAPADGLDALAFFNSVQNAWIIFLSRTPQPNQSPLVLWHTTDGGITWTKSDPLDLSGVNVEFQIPSDLGFIDSQHGWIMAHLGAGMMHDYIAVFTTADGGSTWQRVLDPDRDPQIMSCQKSGLTFSTPLTGWMTGNCPGLMPALFFYRSTNGGINWEQITLPIPEGKPAEYFTLDGTACGIPGMNFSTARSLILTLTCSDLNLKTASSWLYFSTDGGLTWVSHLMPIAYNNQLSFLRTDEGFMVGSAQQDASKGGSVYHVTNGGNGWTLTTFTQWIGQPDFVDGLNGWVIASHNDVSALVHTADGGKTWSVLNPVIQ
jgi:photosystem II stability/assembly factor-like uncharacterized protein